MLAQIRGDRDHLRWMFSDNLKTSKALGLGFAGPVSAIPAGLDGRGNAPVAVPYCRA
jgi:hypothetical protein